MTARRLVDAFARVPREHFLGAGPWQIAVGVDAANPYRTTPNADPAHVYHNVVVALDPARQLNNGQPTALARWIEACDIMEGETIAHVGCGVGYYTAIIAEVAGASGRVVGYEVDRELANRATEMLAQWPNVEVRCNDAFDPPAGAYDVLFVNAGITHVPPVWLGALRPGGRLIAPLTFPTPTMPHGIGAMVRIQRAADDAFAARLFSQVGIYPCSIARDPAHEVELRVLMNTTESRRVTSLVTETHERGDTCVMHLPGFCLQR
ncbi:MAG: protein-L-isoaspartate O-methyltransferase family protein [Kofleriaceae bacterium]